MAIESQHQRYSLIGHSLPVPRMLAIASGAIDNEAERAIMIYFSWKYGSPRNQPNDVAPLANANDVAPLAVKGNNLVVI